MSNMAILPSEIWKFVQILPSTFFTYFTINSCKSLYPLITLTVNWFFHSADSSILSTTFLGIVLITSKYLLNDNVLSLILLNSYVIEFPSDAD